MDYKIKVLVLSLSMVILFNVGINNCNAQQFPDIQEMTNWGRENNGLQCAIAIKQNKIKVGQRLIIDYEIKNVSPNDIYLFCEYISQGSKLVISNENGELASLPYPLFYEFVDMKQFFREIKSGQSYQERIYSILQLKFFPKGQAEDIKSRPILIQYELGSQEIGKPGKYSIALQLVEDESRIKLGKSLGFSNIWTGELISNKVEFSVEYMPENELDDAIKMLYSEDKAKVFDAIAILNANCYKKAAKDLVAIFKNDKSPLQHIPDALIRMQDASVIPDLLELYRTSTDSSDFEWDQHQRDILKIIRCLEPDQQKLEALFIKIVKSGDKIRARQYAARELGMRYSPEIVDALLEAANKEPEQVQYSSITALGRIGEQLPVKDKHIIIELIIKIMRSAQDKRVRDATVNALGRTGSEQVLPYLREALKDSDLFVGVTAASYLGRLGNFEDIAAIEEYLSRTQNDGQKNTAENAIKTLRRRVELE